jgi:hypothetical protein
MAHFLIIISAIPIWVWPLLAGLLFVGTRARHERRSPVWLIYAMPLLGLLSLNRIAPLGSDATLILMVGWGAGLLLGYMHQPLWCLSRDHNQVVLRGESITMITILTLFSMNFAAGMAEGMSYGAIHTPAAYIPYSLIAGALSGHLAGRALYIARMPVKAIA